MDAAMLVEHRGADRELGVRCVRMGAHRLSGGDQRGNGGRISVL
jgi:hypothetical protein